MEFIYFIVCVNNLIYKWWWTNIVLKIMWKLLRKSNPLELSSSFCTAIISWFHFWLCNLVIFVFFCTFYHEFRLFSSNFCWYYFFISLIIWCFWNVIHLESNAYNHIVNPKTAILNVSSFFFSMSLCFTKRILNHGIFS